MIGDLLFTFVVTGTMTLFVFLGLSQWVRARTAERQGRDRAALLRTIAEQPGESADRVIELLREEAVRDEMKRRRRARNQRLDELKGGALVIATGVGLAIFLKAIVSDKPVWTVGIMLILMGLVLMAFSYFRKPDKSDEPLR